MNDVYISIRRVVGAGLIMMLGLVSCRKWVATNAPKDQLTTAQIFSTDRDATLAILGLYIQMMDNNRSLFNGGMSLFGALSSDELYRTFPSVYEDAFAQNTLTQMNPMCSSLYTAAYNWLYLCNNILEHLETSSGLSDSVQQQLKGEALFNRGLIYFYLVNLYGDVPLVMDTDFEKNAVSPRVSTVLVYRQIIDDLLQAQKLLSTQYAVVDDNANARTRPNRAAATALLARVYLYRQDWVNAEQQASIVIGDDAYQLVPTPGDVFFADSKEAIWQLQTVHANISTAEGSLFIPKGGGTGRTVYALTSHLLNSFEQGDLRLAQWTGGSATGSHYCYPYKYKAATAQANPAEYNMVLRLAEQYLIRAEARARLGNTDGAAADLNKVRHRAGLQNTTATNVTDLITAIGQERRVELFAEWGHRWLDLKRTNQADAVLGVEKTGWVAKDTLYPIPYTELLHNPNLVQNSGY